jgi:hypothetical protein
MDPSRDGTPARGGIPSPTVGHGELIRDACPRSTAHQAGTAAPLKVRSMNCRTSGEW